MKRKILLSMLVVMTSICMLTPGKYVPVKETIRGFRAIIDGEMDEYPEAAFFNVGTIDEAVEKAKKLMAQ